MELDYILDDLTVAKAKAIQDKIFDEIWRRYEAKESRGNLLDRYNELENLIFIRRQQQLGN